MRQKKARARQKNGRGDKSEKTKVATKEENKRGDERGKRKGRRKRKTKGATKEENERGSARFGEGNGAVFGVKGGLHVKGSVEGLGFQALHLGEKCHDA
jgi:hypothetical protein